MHKGASSERRLTPACRLQALLAGALLCLLASCETSSRYSTVNTEVLDEVQRSIDSAARASAPAEGLPDEILEALVPGLTLDSAAAPAEERFDLIVPQNMDVREFFSLLTQDTEYSIVLHPDLSGQISSMELKNVTIEEVLDLVSDTYGFVINRRGTIYQVLPGGMQTRIFQVNYLNISRNGNSNMQITSSGISQGGMNTGAFGGGVGGFGGFGGINNNLLGNPNQALLGGMGGMGGGMGAGGMNTGGASVNTITETDYWDNLEEMLVSIVNASRSESAGLFGGSANVERSVIVSPQTGMVVVRAMPDELRQVEEFLASSQAALHRQVILEAKILEVELREGFQAGIDLSVLSEVNGNNEFSAEFGFLGEQIDSISSPVALGLEATDFEGVIRLLETQGNVQVISSPRISTLNNQKAVFKVGDERYFLTNANTTSFGAGDEQTTNQNTNLQPFFSGIALDVTPQISPDGTITLHIHPILSQVQEDIKVISGQEFPLANSTTRESDSIARARNGEVIVISGLMQTRARGQEAGVPGIRDVPVLGDAMEQRQRESVKTELVILLRAIVDDNGSMSGIMQEHARGFENLRRQIDPSNSR